MAGDHHENPLSAQLKNPKPLKFYADVLKRWSPSLMRFGAFGGVMFLYFTDWQLFMDKVPFYGKKFEPKENLV